MGPMTRYPMWRSWLSPFRRSQPKTLAWVVAATASVAQAPSFAVTGHRAAPLGIQRGRAWNQVDRLLRNSRIDDPVLTAPWLRLFGAGRRADRHRLDGMAFRPQDSGGFRPRRPPSDPRSGVGLSQDADASAAKWVGEHVPQVVAPHPGGGRPIGGREWARRVWLSGTSPCLNSVFLHGSTRP